MQTGIDHGVFEYEAGRPGGGRYGNGIGAKYPYQDLDVGDFYVVVAAPGQSLKALQSRMLQYPREWAVRADKPRQFTSRQMVPQNAVRVWRVR